jgi:putative redox protein
MADAKLVTLTWQGRDLVFQGEAPGKAPIIVDGGAAEGPSPVEALLLALAGCTASDVVVVMRKKKVDLQRLTMEVRGQRRDEYPRRYVAIDLVYRITAPGATEPQVRQAIDLSLAKYCSVTHSLAPDIPIRYELVLQA